MEIFRNYGLRRISKAVRQQGMRTAHQEWPRIDGAVNQGEEHYGHHKAPLCLNGEWTGRLYESWLYLALGMMELTVSTLGRPKIQLAFKNGPEGLLRLS